MKPRLLDLFSGAGGCAMGYHLAGFDVVCGVDIVKQNNYPFDHIQADALEFLAEYGHEFDFIHASPPCQQHSSMRNITKKNYEDFIIPTRALLNELKTPYVIENVVGAPLQNPIMLQGNMFEGLKVKRQRLFELSFRITHIAMPTENLSIPAATKGANPINGFVSIVGTGGLGNGLGVDYARFAMQIDWMNRAEISQAIPPAYTQYIGAEWLSQNGYDATYPSLKVPKQLSLF